MKYSLKNTSIIFTLVTIGVFLIAWPLSFYGFQKYENIDLSFIFNILFIVGLLIWNIEKNSFFRFVSKPVFFIFLIFLLFFINSLYNQSPVYEVLVATKPLIIFTLLFYNLDKIGLPILPANLATQILKITIILMFIKYFLSHAFGLNSRPLLFHENNFELVIPLILLFCSKQKNILFSMLLILVIIMSGSKSAIASLFLIPLILFTYRQNLLIKFVISIFMISFGYLIFLSYSEFILRIDRVFFFNNLIKFYDSSILNILFGNFQVSPLQSGICNALSYMTEKVSFDGEKYTCFSRVINFSTIRIFVDFGIVFGLLFYLLWFYSLNKLFPNYIGVTVFFIGFLNGLSVSGFANIYFVIAILLLFSTYNVS